MLSRDDAHRACRSSRALTRVWCICDDAVVRAVLPVPAARGATPEPPPPPHPSHGPAGALPLAGSGIAEHTDADALLAVVERLEHSLRASGNENSSTADVLAHSADDSDAALRAAVVKPQRTFSFIAAAFDYHTLHCGNYSRGYVRGLLSETYD